MVSDPGRVDSPPTSMMSAPRASISTAAASAANRIEIETAVGERIGSDVEDAHDERTGTEMEDSTVRERKREVRSGGHGKG